MSAFFTREQILPAYQYRKSCRHYDPSRKISAEDFNYILGCVDIQANLKTVAAR